MGIKNFGNRDKMRDAAAMVYGLLTSNDRISLRQIAQSLGSSELTARRWVVSFGKCLDLRIEKGVVIVEPHE